MRHPLLAIPFVVTACTAGSDRTAVVPAAPLTVSTAERGSLRRVDSETLSQDAHITDLVPAGDRNGVAFTFADPERHIEGGLGVIDRQHVHAQLVWPDSVTAVWWPTADQLAFTSATGTGISIVVDVPAAVLEAASHGEARHPTQAPSPPPALSPTARTRATTYIDSVRLQLPGASGGTALRYQVRRLLIAPADSVAAFYVVATDSAGIQFNPSWYVLDLRSGQVKPVDSLTARAGDMPMEAAAWTSGQSFFYAKDKALYEAMVRR